MQGVTCVGSCPPSWHAPRICCCLPQKNRVRNGELYRYIADTGGAFAQPALYEGEPGGRQLGALVLTSVAHR